MWREQKVETQHNTRLTSPEVASLWTQYIDDSMNICIKKHVLERVEDAEIRSVYEFAIGLSQKHIEKIKELLGQEKYPIPIGFTHEDVYSNAPRLFSDSFFVDVPPYQFWSWIDRLRFGFYDFDTF
jgi:hypothetical protein